MGDAAGGKFENFDGGAQLERVVDQFAVGASLKGLRGGLRQSGGDLPVFRQLFKADLVRLVVAIGQAEKQAGAVDKAALGIEQGSAHGHIVGVNGIENAVLPSLRRRLPAVFGGLHQRGGAAVALGADGGDVAAKVADHVAAGRPVGQRERLRGVFRLLERQANLPLVA